MNGVIRNFTGYRWFGGTGCCMSGVIRNFTGYRRWFAGTGNSQSDRIIYIYIYIYSKTCQVDHLHKVTTC